MKTDSLFLLPFPCCPVATSSSEGLATTPVPCSEFNKFDNRNVLIVRPVHCTSTWTILFAWKDLEQTWQKSKTASATFSIASIKGSETSSTFQKSWNATFKERSALPWLYCRDRASSPCGWPLCLPHTWTSSQWSGARRTLFSCLSVSVDDPYFMRSFSSDMNSFLLLYASAKLAAFLKRI